MRGGTYMNMTCISLLLLSRCTVAKGLYYYTLCVHTMHHVLPSPAARIGRENDLSGVATKIK